MESRPSYKCFQDCCSGNISSSSSSSTEFEGEEEDKMGMMVLDMDIVSILMNKRLTSDEKCFRYYTAVERYLYKKDPSLKLGQFNFEARTLDDGQVTHVFIPSTRSTKLQRYCKHLPALIGPIIGAAVSTLWK